MAGGVASRVGRSSKQRAAANRLAASVRSASTSKRGALSSKAAVLDRAPRASDFKRVLGKSIAHPNIMSLMPVDTLPAQGVPNPTTYKLDIAGVHATAVDDADGQDELQAWVAVVKPSGSSYVVQTHHLPATGTLNVGAGEGASHPVTLVNTHQTGYLVMSAIIDDDDGSGQARRDELDLLLALSVDVAGQVSGSASADALEAMFNYSAGLLALSGSDVGAVSVESTRIGAADWHTIYSTPADSTAGMDWKLSIPHVVGESGAANLLLNVPADLPERATIVANLQHVNVTGGLDSDMYVYQLSPKLCINSSCIVQEPKPEIGDFVLNSWKVRRDVIHGPGTIDVSVRYRRRRVYKRYRKNGKWRECGEAAELSPCKWDTGNSGNWGTLDIKNGPGGSLSISYNTKARARAGGAVTEETGDALRQGHAIVKITDNK